MEGIFFAPGFERCGMVITLKSNGRIRQENSPIVFVRGVRENGGRRDRDARDGVPVVVRQRSQTMNSISTYNHVQPT